jgi:hypothetical protein
LGIKRLIVKGGSQLVVNFLNKSYTPKDEHMAAYLEELRNMEKRFQGLELMHIPRGEMWKRTKSPRAPLIAWHNLPTSLRSASSSRLLLHHHSDQTLRLPCHRHRSRGLRTVGLLRVIASFWHWHGRREWIGSSSSRPSSSAAGFLRMNRRPKG